VLYGDMREVALDVFMHGSLLIVGTKALHSWVFWDCDFMDLIPIRLMERT